MTLRLVPPIWWLLALGAMAALDRLAPGLRLLRWPWTALGFLFIADGFIAVAWSARHFRGAHTPIHPGHTPTALITGGPYALSRNPIYLGMTIALAGVALLFGALTPWLIVPLFAITMDRLFIAQEERTLEATLGEPYREYKSRVRRWI